MKFELEATLRGATNLELLEELRRCASELGRDTITQAGFAKIGKGHPTTITRRFGSWPQALDMAGLRPSRSKIGISDDELFENLRNVWMFLKRQPRYGEISKPPSQFSTSPYEKRFGGWTNALKKFVEWVNEEDESKHVPKARKHIVPDNRPSRDQSSRRTKRNISERQRFRILLNAGFRCQSCGASPLTSSGTELHVDHIMPWSKGGETIDDNLTCKCKLQM